MCIELNIAIKVRSNRITSPAQIVIKEKSFYQSLIKIEQEISEKTCSDRCSRDEQEGYKKNEEEFIEFVIRD